MAREVTVLYDFLRNHETNLIARCCVKAAKRPMPTEAKEALFNGVPVFIRQLIDTLEMEQHPPRAFNDRRGPGPTAGGRRRASEMSKSATIHGRELMEQGFTVDQVVHAYGDVCQSVTDLAFEMGIPFEINEFRTLNRCLDDAIAYAVMEFSYQRDMLNAGKQTESFNMRLGTLAHEMRNLIQTATLTFTAIKAGTVGLSGSTGAVMERTLVAMRDMVDGSVAVVRM